MMESRSLRMRSGSGSMSTTTADAGPSLRRERSSLRPGYIAAGESCSHKASADCTACSVAASLVTKHKPTWELIINFRYLVGVWGGSGESGLAGAGAVDPSLPG